jgi:hypothetical protein
MLTSDDQAVDGVTCEIVLMSPGFEDMVLTINSKTHGLLINTWRLLESRRGQRISFQAFLSEISRSSLKEAR